MKTLLFLAMMTLYIVASCMQFSHADASVPLVMVTIQGGANSPSCGNTCITPQNVTVSKGTAVEWINNDLVPHSITSGIAGHTDSGVLFNSGSIFAGKFFIHNFNDLGTFHYFDPNYTFDAGTITVTESPIPISLPLHIPINQTKSNAIAQNYGQKPIINTMQSPLEQFKGGTMSRDVHCNFGLQLVFKAEDYTPACVHSETANVLVPRGWAIAHLPDPFFEKMNITQLSQEYAVGQPINATVTYAGYYWYTEPDVKIMDANGTQIWFNCPHCFARTELPKFPSLGIFTYIVRDYSSNNLPMINKTGTYTMIASLDNKTASAEFTIVKPMLLHASFEPCDTPYPQSSNGIAVLYMPANSIGKICVRYSNPNEPKNASLTIFDASSYHTTKSITSWAEPSMIPSGNSTVRYSIKTGNQTGLYGLTIFCSGIPFAVGYDDKSNFTLNDFPWEKSQTISCPMMTYQYKIDSLSGMGVKHIS